MKKTLLVSLFLALALMLALPLAAQAEDYVARDSLCMAVQSGQHNWRLDHYEDATCLHGKIEVDYCSQCGKKCRETISQPGPHTFPSTWDILQTATCTEPGEQIHYCTVCLNASETQPIPALGHSWDGGAVTTDPTCTADGVRTYTCTRISVSGAPCGATRTESIPALGHQWDGGAVTTQPTCTAPGVKTYTCTRQGASGGPCGATKTESVPALGHAEQAVPGKAATCTETGLTEGSKCSRCGTVLKAQETIPALGHAAQTVAGKAATCTETGLTEGSKCSRCGATLKAQESIPALGHTPQAVPGKAATCTEAGLTEGSKCSRCGATLKAQESIPALGHTPQAVPGKAATCTEAGLSEGSKCSRCGATLKAQESIPALGHAPQAVPGKAAACTEAGLSEGSKCSRCGATLKAQETIPALGHSWGDWRQDEPGTCVKAALMVKKCSRCGAMEYMYGAYGDHNWGEWTTVKEPTATEEGLEERICKIESSHREEKPIPATGKAELTIFLEARAKNPDEPKTEFHMYEKYKFHGYVENTGDVPLELYDCDMIVSNGWQSLGHTCDHKRYLLEPGEKVERWNGVWFIDLGGTIDSTTATPGTETAELYGTVTYSVQVPGYKPGTDEVLCTAAASSTIGVLKGDGEIKPSLLYENSWAPDAGVGKRYLDATVNVQNIITNTGNCDVFLPAMEHLGESIDAPHPKGDGELSDCYRLAPGESLTVHNRHRYVSQKDVDAGVLDRSGWTNFHIAYYMDENGEKHMVYSNHRDEKIPLTYPDGTTPEEDKPAIKLTGFQLTPEKEAYVDTHYLIDDNYIECDFIVTNTGNVPLRLRLNPKYGTCSYKEAIWGYGVVLNPGESWDYGYGGDCTYYYIGDWDGYIPPDAADSPYIGTYSVSFKVYGYAVDDEDRTTPICEDGPVTFTHNIVKPGNTPWHIPELSDMDMKIKTSCGGPSDPAGYQLGEGWYAKIWIYNTGFVDIDSPVIHADYEAAHALVSSPVGPNWVEMPYVIVFEPGSYAQDAISGHVKEEDVQRGYIEVSGYVKWTDPDSGNERKAYSNVWNMPVISKTGLLLKKGASDPENGEYFLEGEPIKWSLDVTNNSKEELTDITVNDLGVNVGAFAKLAAGETQPVSVPDHTVTAYEAEVVGYVTNYATATGKDLAGIEHTWPSNPAKALTKPEIPPVGPGGGTDPLGPIYGVHPAVSIQKTDPAGPPDSVSYKEGEEAVFAITVVNTGDCVLKDLRLYDSLAGFAPIATLDALAPAESHVFEYRYTVTGPNADHGFAINSATLTYTFLDGIPGTPMPSNKCKILCGDNPDVTGGGIPAFDPDILHPDGPGLTPVTGPDGTPITGPGGTPIIAPPGTVPVLDPDGHPVTFPGGVFPGPDGTPIVIPAGCPVLLLPDGTHCIITPYGPILCDEDGNPILDADGHLIFLDWSELDVSCQLRLDALGDGEGRYTLHACAAHAALARAAEDAVLNGDSASPIWRAELNNLYELLYTAASDEAKADLLWEREQYLAYVDALEAFAGEEAAAEALRLKVAELCCMIHTFPDALPGSLAGSYAQMLGAAEADASSREIGPMTGSDAPVTEAYAGFARRALADTLSLLHSAKSYDADDVFFRGQSLWQIALDSQVNLLYKNADRDARKRIAAWRIALDSVVNAERPFLTLLYAENPAVAEEVLMNLYKTSALEERLN